MYLTHHEPKAPPLGEPGTKKYRKGHRQYMREYWQARPQKYLWDSAKRRARDLSLPFDIEPEDIQIPEICPITGEKLTQVYNGPTKKTSPTLDRKIPELGYVKGNVFVVSYQGNKYKSDMSKEMLQRLYDYVFTS